MLTFSNEANGFLGCTFLQFDYRELIGAKSLQYLITKLHVLTKSIGGELIQACFPCVGIEYLGARKVQLSALELST